jgi:cellulose synthase/poly-beta-1,6-N-acetylglucosamine synthase-like glycosyltransferase
MSLLPLQMISGVALLVLGYTFAGYPFLIFCLGRRRPMRAIPSWQELPGVTVVLSAHNEETRVVARLQNLLAGEYPVGKLTVVVVSDGSTDGTAGQIQALQDPRVQLLVQPERRGKASALNAALAAAKSEVIVFTDVRQRFAPDTLAQLAKHFGNPQVGAVSGELLIDPAASAVGSGVDVYWRLEKLVRLAEARWDSSIGCTGAVYAIRRGLYRPIPADTILDDVVIPMQIAIQGFRVGFEPAARAFDPQTLEPECEQIRKRRTLAGNYQMFFRHPEWLLPWRNRLWWQLVSHKYLRLAAPFFLALLFLGSALCPAIYPCNVLFYGQCLFYLLAACGLAFRSHKYSLLSLPAGFVFLNWMSLAGLWHYLRSKHDSAWELNRPGPSPHV